MAEAEKKEEKCLRCGGRRGSVRGKCNESLIPGIFRPVNHIWSGSEERRRKAKRY